MEYNKIIIVYISCKVVLKAIKNVGFTRVHLNIIRRIIDNIIFV